MKTPLILFIVAIAIITPSFAQDSTSIEKVSSIYTFWDEPNHFVVEGDYAFVTSNASGMQIIDISDPGNMRCAGSYTHVGEYEKFLSIGVTGENAIVNTFKRLLQINIEDISNPTLENPPVFIINDNYPDISNFCVEDRYACVTAWWERGERMVYWDETLFKLFDFSNPDDPQIIYEEHILEGDGGDIFTSVEMNSSYIFLKDMRGIVNAYELVDFDKNSPTSIFENDQTRCWIQVSDDLMFTIHNEFYTIFDITELPETDTLYHEEFESLRGGLNFSFNEEIGCFYGWDHKIALMDFSDPSSPQQLGELEVDTEIFDLKILDNQITYIDDTAKLNLIDITDPDSPQLAGTFDGSGQALDLAIQGETGFLAAGSAGLRIFNISDIEAPREVSRAFEDIGVSSITVHDNIAFITTLDSIITIADISDIEDISTLSRILSPELPIVSELSGDILYVVDYPNYLLKYGLWDMEEPRWIGGMSTHHMNNGASMCISGDLLLYGAEDYVSIFNIANPQVTRGVSEYQIRGTATGIDIVDNHAYITDSPDSDEFDPSLWILDMSNPEEPQFVSNYRFRDFESIHEVKVEGNFAYIACGEGGLRVLNISDPRHPLVIGYIANQGISQSVEVVGNFAIVANLWDVGIYDCTEALGIETDFSIVNKNFTLLSSYPNPFNNRMNLNIDLSHQAEVALNLYDLKGRLIRNIYPMDLLPAGRHFLPVDGSSLPAGTYFIRMNSEDRIQTIPIQLSK